MHINSALTTLSSLYSLLNMLWIMLGVLSARDALQAVTAGVDGILVSNHGGRQLADVPAPVSC